MTDNREPIGSWSYVTDDEEPWPRDVDPEPYATVDLPRSGAVIVWMLGAIVAALIVAVAWLAWTR